MNVTNFLAKTLILFNCFLAISYFMVNGTLAQPLPVSSPPKIAAKSFLLQDFNSGVILAEQDANTMLEPASITKLMTSYVVFHELNEGNIELGNLVTVSENAWRTQGSRTFIEVNSKVSIETLLKGMIIQSGNDASVALAEHIAGSEESFAELMNYYAKKLNMTNTNFINATGLPDKNHYTTASDIAKLSIALIQEFPEFYRWYSIKEFSYNNIKQHNRNSLLWRDPSVDGLKTGHTDSAGYCLASSAKRDNMRLISVVLGSDSEKTRLSETQKLLNYGFRFFETHELYKANETLLSAEIYKGDIDQINIGINQNLFVTTPRGQFDQLQAITSINHPLIAPVAMHGTVGNLTIKFQNETINTLPLISLTTVNSGGWWKETKDGFNLWLNELF